MSKPIELIYSQQSTGYVEGRAYSNPRYFSTPRAGVSKVYVVGDWPNIVAAYEAMGVPVERLDVAPVGETSRNVERPIVHTAENTGAVAIPDDWEGLAWQKLRSLASQVSTTPIKNSDEAKAAIRAELDRRTAPAIDPLDVPQAEALGLTIRELNSGLTALGVGWDADTTPAEKLRMRDEARALAEAG